MDNLGVESAESSLSLYRDVLARVDTKPKAYEPQDSWELLIAGYLYLGGLGAGSFIMAVVAGWLGFGLSPAYWSPIGDWAWDWSRVFVMWGPFVTALGASLLVFHLGRNWRLFYTAGRNQRTSWMARGFGILSSFIVFGCAVALISVLAPDWPNRVPALWHALELLGVLAALGTAVYTGILLYSTQFIPAWKSPFLPFLFLASALSTGAMGIALAATVQSLISADPESAHRLMHFLESIEIGVVIVEGSILTLYLWFLRRGEPEGALSVSRWMSGSLRVLFWGGIVTLALAMPLVVDAANLGVGSDVLTVVASTSVLIGGFVLRIGVLKNGIKVAPPLYKLARWRGLHPVVSITSQRHGAYPPTSPRRSCPSREQDDERQSHPD